MELCTVNPSLSAFVLCVLGTGSCAGFYAGSVRLSLVISYPTVALAMGILLGLPSLRPEDEFLVIMLFGPFLLAVLLILLPFCAGHAVGTVMRRWREGRWSTGQVLLPYGLLAAALCGAAAVARQFR